MRQTLAERYGVFSQWKTECNRQAMLERKTDRLSLRPAYPVEVFRRHATGCEAVCAARVGGPGRALAAIRALASQKS